MGDVDEVPVIEIFGDAVAAPGAASHAQRKVEPIIETAAIAVGMRLIDEHAHHVDFFGELARALKIARVHAAGMAATLIRENFFDACNGSLEILCAIKRKHQRKFFAGEREIPADAGFLDDEEFL